MQLTMLYKCVSWTIKVSPDGFVGILHFELIELFLKAASTFHLSASDLVPISIGLTGYTDL